MLRHELATSLTLNIEKYCYSCVNGLADLWCLRGRCLPIKQVKLSSKDKYRINLRILNQINKLMPNHNPRLKIWKRVFPGKTLYSDVGIPEVSISGSQHLQFSAYF